ncbi:MAG: glycerophosphodiester phosphodiesterase [Janthinobacterium lividum]
MASALRTFPIVGHRGAPYLEPPGNTLASLRRAVEAGAQMLEVDVRHTRDDVLVLDHENVHLLDGEEVPLRDRSLSQWRQHGGEWGSALMTLEEVLSMAMEADIGLMLDFKEPGTEGAIARAIRKSKFPLSSLLVAGAGESSRRILRGLDPRIPLSLTLGMEDDALITPRLLLDIDTEAVTWHHRLLTPQRVDILHRRDILVYAWTVDLSEDIRRMHHVCHVDGIVTNSPDMAKQIVG